MPPAWWRSLVLGCLMSLLWRFLHRQTRAEREQELYELRRREVEALVEVLERIIASLEEPPPKLTDHWHQEPSTRNE
jgi:hypothetical protein